MEEEEETADLQQKVLPPMLAAMAKVVTDKVAALQASQEEVTAQVITTATACHP